MPDMTPTPDDQFPAPLEGAPEAGPKGFLASPTARIVVIVGAVAGLLVIVGVVVALVLLNLGKKAIEQTAVEAINTSLNATVTATATRTVETTSQGTKLSIPVTNKDVFVSRDPFEPVLKPLPPATVSSETTIPASERNVLTLQDIVSTNGELKALVKWDGVQYTVGANQQLGTSPWKVLSITKTTVTMLYGDVQVTLSIGEGVQRD